MEKEGVLFVVSAPSGAGKTTLCKEITKILPNLKHSISYTTRSLRPGEINGRDYYFVSEEHFRGMIKRNEFAEWARVHGHLYGTPLKGLLDMKKKGMDVLLDIDPQWALQLKKKYKNGVFIYILPPSLEALKLRLMERRSDSSDQIKRRLQVARKEIQNYRNYSYLMVNDDFKKALRELEAIITAERLRMKRLDSSWIEEYFIKSMEGG